LLGFADQEALARAIGLNKGVPNFRWISTPRVGTGPERVKQFIDQIPKALMDPLTAKEKESGLYTPPPNNRIAFTGTLVDAQAFYQKTSPMNSCRNCPIVTLTDGLPIVIPTEEAVKQILTGTSHQANEAIATYSYDGQKWIKNTAAASFPPLSYTGTVELVAVNAVMAGCKPNYLPVVLAAVQGGANFFGSSGPWGYPMYISGPIAKTIGANAKQPFQVGNPANVSIGRACELCQINIGGSAQGITNTNMGNPINRTGMCFVEDASALPTGWLGQNELVTYKASDNSTRNFTKNDNLVFTNTTRSQVIANFSPQSFQNLNKGVGDLARALGVEGKPGNYNILQYLLPSMIGSTAMGATLPAIIMSPGIAKSLYDAGFTSKQAVIKWVSDNDYMTVADYQGLGWYDFSTSGGTSKMPGTNIAYMDAPPATPWHEGDVPAIIVTNSGGDETIMLFGSWTGLGTVGPIDAWK
jgi:hypothetical protein